MKVESTWTVYHTRFVVRARQLSKPLVFTDVFGREQSGQPGDYLVESSEGFRSITSRHVFEDIYVPLHASLSTVPSPGRGTGSRSQPSSVAHVSASP